MLLRAGSLADTHAISASLAELARPGDLIALAGEMGAGKTAFAQGFGRALGITDAITSPTFTLVHSYPVPGRRLTLHHADLYRLDSTGDIDDLALHELAEFNGIVLIEWGDIARAAIGDHLEVRLGPDADLADLDSDPDSEPSDVGSPGASVAEFDVFGLDGCRLIEVEAIGAGWVGRWDRLVHDLAEFRC